MADIERYDPFEGALGFSLATRVGDLVFTAGMIGVDDAVEVAEDPADEFRQVFANLAGVLEAVGSSFEHVLDMTSFFTGDIDALYPVFEEVRKEVFVGHPPASTAIAVAQLLDARCHVDVKLTAFVPRGEGARVRGNR